jgi:hypothetical protein
MLYDNDYDFDYAILNGNYYILRTIELRNKEIVTISTTDLNHSLFDDEKGQYTSEKARHIDECIFYFVNKYEILLPEEVLSELVYREALL